MSKKNNSNPNLINFFFALLVIIFFLLVGTIFKPDLSHQWTSFFLPVGGISFFIISLILFALVIKSKLKGKLRFFLLLTSMSALIAFVSVILHNLIYALITAILSEAYLEEIGFVDEPVFFIIALIIAPLCFIIGAIGSVVMMIKNSKR